MTIVTSKNVADDEETVTETRQIIMEETIIQDGHDGVIAHLTDEDGNSLVIEEANSCLSGAADVAEDESTELEDQLEFAGVKEEEAEEEEEESIMLKEELEEDFKEDDNEPVTEHIQERV